MSFQFTWPAGLGDRVMHRVKAWMTLYDKKEAGAIPVNPRKVVPPGFDEDQAFAFTNRFKHEIGFRLNEIRWLKDMLNEEDETTSVAQAIMKAYNNHVAYVQKHPEYTDEYKQWYDFTYPEVRYLFQLLNRIKMGMPTFAQEKKTKEDLAKGEW